MAYWRSVFDDICNRFSCSRDQLKKLQQVPHDLQTPGVPLPWGSGTPIQRIFAIVTSTNKELLSKWTAPLPVVQPNPSRLAALMRGLGNLIGSGKASVASTAEFHAEKLHSLYEKEIDAHKKSIAVSADSFYRILQFYFRF